MQTDLTTVLTAALKFKYFTSAFYAKGLAMTYPTDFRPEERQVLLQIAKHEAAHVTTLRAAIGGAAPAAPAASSYDFTGGGGNGCGPFRGAFGASAGTSPTGSAVDATDADPLEFLKLALIIEELGVRALAGGLTALMGTAHLATIVRMRSTDARHSAGIRRLRNQYQYGYLYVDPGKVAYYGIFPWVAASQGDYTGGVDFADVAYTSTSVYPGGLSQTDIINGTASSSVVDGETVQTTVTTGVYGPSLAPYYNVPKRRSPNEDNAFQSSSQVTDQLIIPAPNLDNAGVGACFDEPMSPSSAAALTALFGVS